MAKKGKKRNIKKMKGGSKISNLNEETFDTTQVISIVLLAIALVLGVLLYMQRSKRKTRVVYKDKPEIRYREDRPSIAHREQPVAQPININIDDGKSFYEEKVERRLEPPGVVYEPDRYMPRYVEPKPSRVPINIRTRGSPSEYQQIGILTNEKDVRPIYGRQTYRGSNQWNYYSSLDSNLSTKIPIFKSTDKCTDERGCTEINDGDSVTIGNQDATTYNFTKYSNDSFRYIPDVF